MEEQPRRARDYTRSLSPHGDRLRSLRSRQPASPLQPNRPDPEDPDLRDKDEKRRIRRQRRRIWRQLHTPRTRTIVIIASCLLVLAAGGWLYKWQHDKNAPPSNPFTPSIIASMKFPIYYPTKLPAGYRMDTKSVQVPQANVVVITMKGPHGAKLYMSEVPRPARYNVGGYFLKLDDLKETAVAGGTIATGRTGSTEVSSRLYNATWVLSNTRAAIPFDQLVRMLRSLTIAS